MRQLCYWVAPQVHPDIAIQIVILYAFCSSLLEHQSSQQKLLALIDRFHLGTYH